MSNYYEVVTTRSETVHFSVKANSEDEAIEKYKNGEYIDGFHKEDYEYVVKHAEKIS